MSKGKKRKFAVLELRSIWFSCILLEDEWRNHFQRNMCSGTSITLLAYNTLHKEAEVFA